MLIAGMKVGQAQAAQAAALKEKGATEAKAQIEQAKAAAPGTNDLISQVERLSALHKSGALSDEEFAAAKKKLLG
jgi:multidrug resistance efflux pump